MVENPVVSGRITPSQKKEMKELKMDVKEAIKIGLTVKRDENGLKKVELMDLLNENERLSMKIVMNNERVSILKEDLGFENYSNEQLTNRFVFSQISESVQAVLHRFHVSNQSQGKAYNRQNIESSLGNFLENDKNRKYIELKANNCGLTVEQFENELIKIFESSKQQVLIE